MPLILTPTQMDALIDDRLAGHTRVSNTITDHEDDGRLFRHLTFTDPQGQLRQFNYMWSPWDGNDYGIFATAEDEVQVKAETPAPVVTPPVVAAPAPPARVITHTLAEVKHLPDFQVAIVDMYRKGKFGTPAMTLAEAKTEMRGIAERYGLSDRDVIDAVHDPRTCGIRPPKTVDEAFTPKVARSRRRPG